MLILERDVRNQIGNAKALSVKDNSQGREIRTKTSLQLMLQVESDDEVSVLKQQWIQSEPVQGSRAYTLHVTPQGELYVLGGRNPSIFKLSNDGTGWKHVFDIILLKTNWSGNSPIAKWNDTLYFIPSHELFASKDDGKTWQLIHSWNREYDAVQIILTDQVFYLAFDKGIFRSYDLGNTWEEINEGLMGKIRFVVNIQNNVFVGTDNGFYRLMGDTWMRLKFPVAVGMIRSIASTEEKLYVAVVLSDDLLDPRKVSRGLQRSWWIYRSTDFGNSWTDITPTNAWNVNGWAPFVKLIASGQTLLAMENGMVCSNDSGDTWQPTHLLESSPSINADIDRSVVVKGNIFYVTSAEDGLHRSINNGKSWNKVNFSGESQVNSLIALKATNKGRNTPSILYARSDNSVMHTINEGRSWNFVPVKIQMAEPNREVSPDITHIVKCGDKIYAKGGDSLGRGKTQLYRISTDDNILDPIDNLPIFDSLKLEHKLSEIRMNVFDLSDKSVSEQLKDTSFGATEFFNQLAKWDPQKPDVYIQLGFRTGAFTVSNDTYYMEYNYKLFRWEHGDTEWYDTGLEETIELTLDIASNDLKLAASGDTVYAGKRDGHLVVSLDKGNNWVDLTPALPFTVKDYKEIVIVDDTVYVATDAGVAASDQGNNWGIVTDADGTNHIMERHIMERLTVDRKALYGVTKTTGIYRLGRGSWEQIVSEIPDRITSLAVDGNTIYVGTLYNGMLHFNLEK